MDSPLYSLLPQDEVYPCANCNHNNVNPERDEDGDLVCEECGHILPEPVSKRMFEYRRIGATDRTAEYIQ
jgi:DNA-directed RNA polymerase subunit RPC12/RpoP